MSKKAVRYIDLGRYQIPITLEEEKQIEKEKREGETNKQFVDRILKDFLHGNLSYGRSNQVSSSLNIRTNPTLTANSTEQYTVPRAETELTDQLLEWEQDGIFKVEWCNYGTIVKEDERLYKIHCSNPKTPKAWLPKDRLILPTICRNCGSRREGARESKQREREKLIPKSLTPQELEEQQRKQKEEEEAWKKRREEARIQREEREKRLAEEQRKREEAILKEMEEVKRKRRYAISHEVYEKYCNPNNQPCLHFLGYYSDAEKKFGVVECDAKECPYR